MPARTATYHSVNRTRTRRERSHFLIIRLATRIQFPVLYAEALAKNPHPAFCEAASYARQWRYPEMGAASPLSTPHAQSLLWRPPRRDEEAGIAGDRILC